MEDFEIEAVVDSVNALEDNAYKARLDKIIEGFMANPGKRLKLFVFGETSEVTKKKARSLRVAINRLSKIDNKYAIISIKVEEKDGQIEVYAQPHEPSTKPAGKAKTKRKAKNDSEQVESAGGAGGNAS